ncbi:hypothetical protein [Phaeocystidibacter luteus]|uniref:Outer membrane beta-barrel protein n=1 Tax=Phaeocystidibacter luteus TaxID=911197 RepID=A0A6N6RH17_9FLAO|nr:hypothetical protein [Phaeocystidibacter luteus]KAB2810385.1 hypothetical protein F8C67_07295 [Phaeocystidibacter luteus]
MKNFAYTLILGVLFTLVASEAKAQQLLSLHSGYDFQFDAVYVGVGGEFNEKMLVSADLGVSSEKLFVKANFATRFLNFKEAEVTSFLGLGGGRSFPQLDGFYNDWMAELFLTVRYYPFYVGYSFGFYLPEDPNLEGYGNYHSFRIGVLIGN